MTHTQPMQEATLQTPVGYVVITLTCQMLLLTDCGLICEANGPSTLPLP
jgi:hypothetical protein